MTDISPLTVEEEALLRSKGKEPARWASVAAVVSAWGVSVTYVNSAISKRRIPRGIILDGRRFLPREVMKAQYLSGTKDKEARIQMMETLGELPDAVKKSPQRRNQASYLKTLSDRVSIEDWVAIIDKAVTDAKGGDRYARNWLSNYLIGTPIQRIAAIVGSLSQTRFSEAERREALRGLFNADTSRDNGSEPGSDESIIEVSYTDSAETGR